ncbi:MAG TPA: aspartate-semialdehyde dehydrogenase [Phycisphaerae bacterium]|nr:aspartate-semialdehyde dehydrogenase [Phycisphaerae bacterium]
MFHHVAIVGATGAVGREFIDLLARPGLQARRITLLASARSAGTTIDVNGAPHTVAELNRGSFQGVDLAFFSAGAAISRRYAPPAVEAGAVVVDNSSAFRMDDGVPLVVPEINPQAVRAHRGIIANPNCSTIVMVMAVWPLHAVNPVRRIVVSTYQAASGAGAAAMRELQQQTRDALDGRPLDPKVFPFPIAFNLFSHDSPIDRTGYNAEEIKMVNETRKIFGDPSIAITATCIRVPVLRAHSAAVNLTFERPITPDEARSVLSSAPGVRVVDSRAPQHFPMPIEADGIDQVLVGRIRQDISQPDGRGLDLFVSGDQLRKGAALNAIQIAELLAAGA